VAKASLAHERYESGEVLGQGAQGFVLRVVDRESPSRALVAKVWRARARDEGELASEFALLARLRVRGLVRAHDLGRDECTGAPFFVEDFVDGPAATDWVAAVSRGAAANARLVRVMADVASALAGLHEAGFAHGDLKPAHVRVLARAPDEAQAVLLDLGAAVSRACPPDAPVALTPPFASPEARSGGRVTAASDLYGLGALAWAIATGDAPPQRGRRPAMRSLAPWVQPAIADVVEALLATHPGDRPTDAMAVLRRLGAGVADHASSVPSPPPPIGRERELRSLLARAPSGVRYVTGPSGTGKSHLVQELVTRALLAGRDARFLAFPGADARVVSRLVAYLRGAREAWPFATGGRPGDVLLVLDGLEAAPRELAASVDAWGCRPDRDPGPQVVATVRTAPEGADALTLGPLEASAFGDLCRALGIEEGRAVEDVLRASGGNPGWLVASCGRVPLSRDVALERVRDLSREATEALAGIALCGGAAPEGLCGPSAVRELLQASLVTRRVRGEATSYALAAPRLASDLAAALTTFDVADRTAAVLLSGSDAAMLLAVAQGPVPPARRDDLLARAATSARAQGLRSEEIDALFALAASPARRDAGLLCRLERLTRDSGSTATHPQVLEWLDEAARSDEALRPLALRRRAEKAAREGQTELARDLAEQARRAAGSAGDAASETLAVATAGAVALWRGDWTQADALLGDARARLAAIDVGDPEEAARVDHNFGVVALYRGRFPEAIAAFERSLETKRKLGDRSGVRSCLLNLGLALAKQRRFDDAARALEEATALARSLGQQVGLAWSLAARADVEVRRGRAADAERWVAEAEALGDLGTRAPVVRADLLLLRAQIALLEGDGARALEAVAKVDAGVRGEQALVDVRARVLEARGHLATLPADRRRAARLAIDALRRSRAAALPEVEGEALAALREARGRRADALPHERYPRAVVDPARGETRGAWQWLATLAAGSEAGDAAMALARLIARESGAERAFVAEVDATGFATRAWGVDLDGIALAEPERRLDRDLARAALAIRGAAYQRDVETPGGRGSRIAVAARTGGDAAAKPTALVVAEHRFQSGRFDHVREEDAHRWATLAGVLLRVLEGASSTDAPSAAPARVAGDDALARPGDDDMTAGAAAGLEAPSTVLPRLEPRRAFPSIVGTSQALRRALARLDAAVDGDLPVLVVGETGVGKELFARALHELGPRARRPFVAVNCAAIPDSLFETELFGHARGSFTGADRARSGLLARAEGGTLLLDEIGEMPLARQAALLRALETRRFRPVGADEERPFDVRVVSATNRDLEQAVAKGTFRRDLLYRLNVVRIVVPPLRERTEDVALLARSFLDRAGCSATIANDALAALAAYDWPGNVRELEHAMQRAASGGVSTLRLEHLPRAVRSRHATRSTAPDDERTQVERALARTGGNISHAARALGLTRQGLKKRMVRLGVRVAGGGRGSDT
jgi:transcriptional regulator with AAA-type ATPase domain/tetratricopeptide (TPR) repeat protein